MKKIAVTFVAIFVVLVVCAIAIISFWKNDEQHQLNTNTPTESISVTKDNISTGALVLINRKHEVNERAVPDDLIVLSKHPQLMKDFTVSDDTIQVSKHMLKSFQQMVNDAKKDGISHFVINSSYRSKKEQAKLYKTKGKDIALPAGASEHNLGLSLDIGSGLGLMENVKEGKWLAKNAAKYGFILRYPEDKTDITHIQYEAWHFRYVGLPHSLIMQQHDWVLEEYLDYLKTHDRLTETVNGVRYTVYYQAVHNMGKTSVNIPLNDEYTISGDNDQGVIITYWKPQQATTTETTH